MTDNFLGLPVELSGPKNSEVHLLPIPYDSTASYKPGARDGARSIIQASRFVELFDAEFPSDFLKIGVHTAHELEPDMTGPEKMTDVIYRAASSILGDGKFLIGLGGEHTVSIGLVKAHIEEYKDVSVLQFDAHADLRDSYMGSSYSHACTMARIREMTNIVQVGIRSLSREEDELQRDLRIPVFTAEEVLFSKNTEEKISDALTENVYITFDIDALDPSIMPATGTPEPGGLDWYSVMRILREVSSRKNIIGFDIVELSPVAGNIAPDFLAAKLTLRLLGYALKSNGEGPV